LKDNDSDWPSAVARAAGALARDGNGSLVFHERRCDLRLGLATEEGPDSAVTTLAGVSIRRELDPHRTCHLSRPSPEEIVDLARGRVFDGAASRPAREDDREPDLRAARAWLETAVETAARALGTGASIRATWVEAIQQVVLARPGLTPVTLERRGRRVRIDAAVARGSRRATAAVERAFSTHPDPDPLARDVALRAIERLDAFPCRPGPATVLFDSGVGGVLVHESIGHALEADTVGAGESALAAAGGRVAPAEVSVIDDPRRGRVPWRVDDEGSPTAPTPLLRDGRVAGALHDLASARRAGAAPTGHGRRSSYRDPILPRMGCTFLSAGRGRAEDLLAGTREGVLVRRMEGAWADPRRGVATFRVTDADAIEQGRRSGPLEPFLMIVDTRATLSTIDAVADDLSFDVCVGTCVREGQPLATSVGAPTFRTRVNSVVTGE